MCIAFISACTWQLPILTVGCRSQPNSTRKVLALTICPCNVAVAGRHLWNVVTCILVWPATPRGTVEKYGIMNIPVRSKPTHKTTTTHKSIYNRGHPILGPYTPTDASARGDRLNRISCTPQPHSSDVLAQIHIKPCKRRIYIDQHMNIAIRHR